MKHPLGWRVVRNCALRVEPFRSVAGVSCTEWSCADTKKTQLESEEQQERVKQTFCICICSDVAFLHSLSLHGMKTCESKRLDSESPYENGYEREMSTSVFEGPELQRTDWFARNENLQNRTTWP